MPGNYVVKQGDHLSSIAQENGFSDYAVIWDHANNAELKKKRENPNVLFPGDVLFIPDREIREETRPTDQRHEFVLRKPVLRLRIVLEDLYEKPIAGAKCLLIVEGVSRDVTTDGNGKINEIIPPDAHQSVLVIRDPQTPFHDLPIPIKIGHLDPVEEPSGQAARLANLGYYLAPADQLDAVELESAVEEFQCDFHLKVDGICGPATQARLKQAHGC
jgi:N-acetylmuramoyl-L-alanine amidase